MVIAVVELMKQKLWHAFDALDINRKGVCPRTQLKVLTHNVASSLSLELLEVVKKFDESIKEETLSFLEYCQFIQSEIFSLLPIDNQSCSADTKPPAHLKDMIDKFDEVCWFVCASSYNISKYEKLSDEQAYQLWQIFNILAETDTDGSVNYPVALDWTEIVSCLHRLLQTQSQTGNHDQELSNKVKCCPQYKFIELLDLVENETKLIKEELQSEIQDIHREMLKQTNMEGYLSKKGPTMAGWKERFFILLPYHLEYYTSRDLTEQKGTILLSKKCKLEILADRSGHKMYKFSLVCPGRTYELNAPDNKTRTEWMTALESAIENCENLLPPQRVTAIARQRERQAKRLEEQSQEEKLRLEEEERRKRMEEEARKLAYFQKKLEEEQAKRKEEEEQRRMESEHNQEMLMKLAYEKEHLLKEQERYKQLSEEQRLLDLQQKQQELEQLNQQREQSEEQLRKAQHAKEELEAKLLHEATLRQAELRRLKELQEMKDELSNLLHQERQAKEDEAMVRTLQARALEEEAMKREELERLQEELRSNLMEEKEKREVLEMRRKQLDEQLKNDQDQLEQLQFDRMAKDAELQEALDKLKIAEKTRHEVEKKLEEKSKVMPIVSHRGLGAFPAENFVMRQASNNNIDTNVK